MAEPLLELRGVSLSFGGLKVVSSLDLTVNKGEIVSVIGPNGAGKTTLFNLVTGIYEPDHGEILVNGRNIVGLEPHQITHLGVARTFQTLRLFLNLSVRERTMPRIVLSVVDLPDALPPSRHTSSPAFTSRFRSCRMWIWP